MFDQPNHESPSALRLAFLLAVTLVCAEPAHAHTAETSSGLLSGLSHPITGWDHVLAMVAVGLWGTFLGKPAIWMLPVLFPMVMAVGAAIGVVGLPLPGVETAIALSSIVLGACIALALRLPLWAALAIVGLFAIFHGHAHGTELPASANPVAYAVGFVFATGLLHLSGIALGALAQWPAGRFAVRVTGTAISLTGIAFLVGLT